MVKIDLITGFLGSGKTTFIKKYVQYLLKQGLKIGIIENDFGAVNVDMMLLQDLISNRCELEMVAGAGDLESHRRRLKTKLISMKMRGIDRIIIEPSGIYDVDEFFDVLHEDPLDNWYEIGSVITIVDAKLDRHLSRQSRYLLASQIVVAGQIVLSKTQSSNQEDIEYTIEYLNKALEEFHGKKRKKMDFIYKNWDTLSNDDYQTLINSGYKYESIEKLWFDQNDTFRSLYFMNKKISKEKLIKIVQELMNGQECGNIFRIKGFILLEDNTWLEINATKSDIEIKSVENGQEIIIVIGENLIEKSIQKYFL